MTTPSHHTPSVGQKRSAKDFEQDNEDLAAAPRSSKRTCTLHDHEFRKNEPSFALQQQRSQPQLARPRVRRSLEDFPPIDQPLPAKISLLNLAKEFPNHLLGYTMRRFIEDGWTWNYVFSCMDPIAQKALAHEKPWEVIRARFEDEEEKMEEEKVEASRKVPSSPVHASATVFRHSSTNERVVHRESIEQIVLEDSEFFVQHPEASSAFKIQTRPLTIVQGPDFSLQSDKHHRHQNATAEFLEFDKSTVSKPSLQNDAAGQLNGSECDEVSSEAPPLLTGYTDSELAALMKQEVERQIYIIGSCSDSLSSVEARNSSLNIWHHRAQRWEEKVLEAFGTDEVDLPASKGHVYGFLRRHVGIHREIHDKRYPPPNDQTSDQYRQHAAIRRRNALHMHLGVLRSWTDEWQKGSLSEQKDRTQESKGSREHETLAAPQRSSILSQLPQELQAHPAHHHQSKTRELDILDPSSDQGLIDDWSQQGGSLRSSGRWYHRPQVWSPPQQTRRQPEQSGGTGSQGQFQLSFQQSVEEGYQQSLQGGNHLTAQPNHRQISVGCGILGNSPALHAVHHKSSTSNIAAGSGGCYPSESVELLGPATLSTQQPGNGPDIQPSTKSRDLQSDFGQGPKNVGQQQPAAPNAQFRLRNKQRGAPRRRMFIQAPPRDAPLPMSALTSDDEILNRYPEHLSHPVIMQRFVESSQSRPGGYRTNLMVEALLQHANKSDSVSMAPDRRKAAVKAWVTKEKDATNKKLKQGLVPSSVPASMIAAIAPTQPDPRTSTSTFATAAPTPAQTLHMQPDTPTPASNYASVFPLAPTQRLNFADFAAHVFPVPSMGTETLEEYAVNPRQQSSISTQQAGHFTGLNN